MTYFVALRFIARDDGVAAGEPIECLSPAAVVMRAEALNLDIPALWHSAGGEIRPRATSAMRR